MPRRSGGRVPRWLLKVALVGVFVAGLVVVYSLAGSVDRVFSGWSGPVQVAVLVAAAALALTLRSLAAREPGHRAAPTSPTALDASAPVGTPEPVAATPIAEQSGPALAGASPHRAPPQPAVQERERRPAPTVRAFAEACDAAAAGAADVSRVLAEVTGMCLAVAEHLEDNRREAETLERLVARLRLRDRQLERAL